MAFRRGDAVCAVAAGLSLLAAACDRPDWTDPESSKGPRTPPGDAKPPPRPPIATTEKPLPPLPAWAGEVMGKPVHDAFPKLGACVGNADGVWRRHVGASPGSLMGGWGWDFKAQSEVKRVVLVDLSARIVGAGDGGVPYPEVMKLRPEVKSPNTAWQAVTPKTSGPVDVFGIVEDGTGLCPLGHLDL